MTTPLVKVIRAEIARFGPLRLADYMALCLLHPEYGYYTTRDPLGAAGDFTTAPEISQMFGELLGLLLVQAWQDHGQPKPFLLVEPGPGRGTLMADILRVARAQPAFLAAADIHLIEASASLRAIQKQRLSGFDISWNNSLDELPHAPLFLIANEFLDALPLRQFIRAPGGWQERMVGLSDDDTLCFGLAAPTPMPALDARWPDVPVGEIVEVNAAAEAIIATIARRISSDGGLAVVIDYGHEGGLGDSFQAVRAHRPVDPLATPGNADLTAHVDFRALIRAALDAVGEGRQGRLNLSPVISQGVLLERLGITTRARQLAKHLDGAALHSHIAAHRRLTHPEEMGSLFKALALSSAGCPPPPGFEKNDD